MDPAAAIDWFKAYEAVPDKESMHYIRGLRNGHQDGTAVITDANLMNQDANYYKDRKQIFALEAKLRKTLTDKKGQHTGNQSKNKSSTQSPAKPAKPGWLADNTPPKEGGMNKPREWAGRTWWYCDEKTGGKCPGMWRCGHKPSDCKYDDIKAKRKAKTAEKSKGETDAAKKKKAKGLAVRMAEATQAVVIQDLDNSDE